MLGENLEAPVSTQWGFEDLGLVLGAILPSLLVGVFVVRLGRAAAPGVFSSEAVSTLAYQFVFYAMLLAALWVVIAVRHGQPFWRSLGWTLRFPGAWMYLAAAPVLAVGLSAMGVLLRTPAIVNPIEDLMGGGISRVVMMVFIAVLGPLWEELMFRGFLFPLIERTAGAIAAVVFCAVPFALIHGFQNQWAWQPLTLIGVAGVVFGLARYRTGSTAAAALMHMGYNSTLLIGYLLQKA